MNVDDKYLEELADKALLRGDTHLASVLYAFIGARMTHMDDAFALHCSDWAKKRVQELEQFKNRKNN